MEDTEIFKNEAEDNLKGFTTAIKVLISNIFTT